MINRRDILRLGLGTLMSGGLYRVARGSPARAETSSGPKNLVIALAFGGWDPLYVFDPKPDSPEVDRIPGDVRYFDDLPLWVHADRPSVTAFFEAWSSRSAVLNGIAVESLAHETCIDVMLTGAAGTGAPDLGARAAAALGADRALPYLALSPHAEVRGYEAMAGMLGDTNQLLSLANAEFGWPRPGTASGDKGLDLSATERALISDYLQASEATIDAAWGGSVRGEQLVADYLASRSRMNALQAAGRAGGMFADASLFNEVENPWPHVAAALAEGLSRVAIVQPQLFWDTHGANRLQVDAYESFFFGLHGFLEDLRRQGVLDDTVVLVVSEMGRTPRHNAEGGKDHWPWTSAMLIGSEVRGGQVIGPTDEWLRPSAIDLHTGAEDPSGVVLHAGHVLATAAQLVGLDGQALLGREVIHAACG